jgi:hypothetical protein
MINLQLAVTTRLSFVKNILSIFLILTIALTWPLWTSDRLYPLFPGIERFSSVHAVVAYALPSLLIFSLLMSVILVRPRFFILLSLLLCITLLLLDSGRAQYWFGFYTLILVVLLGYNWRVDNVHRYLSTFNAIKVIIAAVFLVTAIQHLQGSFIKEQWPAFIKPFERFWTPEQCAYLLKISYVIPFIELFIVIGLFVPVMRITAICFAMLFHGFSLVVICLQAQYEPAVICWHLAMLLLIPTVFAGSISTQKAHGFSFGLYPTVVLVLFGISGPLLIATGNKTPLNKIDLMQSNHGEQCIYLNKEDRDKLPLYIQSFAMNRESNLYKLDITAWGLHETKTREVLGLNYLMQVTNSLDKNYGVEALVAIPSQEVEKAIALK